MTAITTSRRRTLNSPIVKFLVLCWPFIVGTLVVGLFFRVEGAETITRQVWLPDDARVIKTTDFSISGMTTISVEEFRQLGIVEPDLFIEKSSHLKLIYLREATDPEVNGLKTEVTLAEAGFGQRISDYTIDQENQTVTVNLSSNYWSVPFFYGAIALTAVLVTFLSWLLVYQDRRR